MKTLLLPVVVCLMAAGSLPAATILFNLQGKGGAGLLSTNENGTISGTPGSGGEIGAGISFDDATLQLTVNVGWGSGNGFTDLTGSVTGSHIHGPTTSSGTGSFTENAGVLFSLPRVSSTANGGSISTAVTLTSPQAAELMAGRYYINIHTGTNAGGEIRGNLVAVPEPGRALLLLAGAGMMGWRRRRTLAVK